MLDTEIKQYNEHIIPLVKELSYSWCLKNMVVPTELNSNTLTLIGCNIKQHTIQKISQHISFDNVDLIERDYNYTKDIINKLYLQIKTWEEFIYYIEHNRQSFAEDFVDRMMCDAVLMQASDIHIAPLQDYVKVNYRVFGKIKNICTISHANLDKILMYLKIVFSVDVTSVFKPRDSSIMRSILGKKSYLRISFHKCIHGEKIAIRLMNKIRYNLNDIGYPEYVLKDVKDIIHSTPGMVLFVGPTGSGKTTSMYSSLSEINTDEFNVMSVEDPVEIYVDGIHQTDVNQQTDMNFIDCLRSLLRQDPDVIMIGEIRDEETASIAIRASVSGHKVFSTLHAEDVLGAIDRLLEFGITKRSIIDNIAGIVAQRIVYSEDKNNSVCIVAESLRFNRNIRQIIYGHNGLISQLRNNISGMGYKTLFDSGMEFVKSGQISYKKLLHIIGEDNGGIQI